MFDLNGKTAIVTGSTKGIGKAIARRMAEAGARVVISSRKADVCAEVANELKAQGLDVMAVPCHVGDREQVENLVNETNKAWGDIDILVCNAATNPVYGPTSELSDEAFDKIMSVNVRSVVQLANLTCPQMARNGGGRVIVISSIAGLRGNSVIGAYGMSKAAEAALARNLAVEWGPQNITVNAIAPGLVRTDFARALWEDPVRLERIENSTPLRRIGEPDDIAGIAVFLASKAGSYITGQTIVADGGETIC